MARSSSRDLIPFISLLACGLAVQGCLSSQATETHSSQLRAPASIASASEEIRTIPMAATRYDTHEPAGMTMITDRAFNAKGTEDSFAENRGEGWVPAEASQPWTIEHDSSAPVSPDGIARFTFKPVKLAAGKSYDPGFAERMLGTVGSALYLRTWIRYSANFQGQDSGGNALELDLGDQKRVRIVTEPMGSDGPIGSSIVPPAQADGRDSLPMNVNTIFAHRGEWFQLEVLCELNTPGVRNGTIRWWINGTLAGEYTDVGFNSASESDSYSSFRIHPVWGGAGETIRQRMSIDFDHVYLSTK